MSDESVSMPRYVDEPPVMLMWTSDEIGTFFFFFIMGFLMETIIIFLIIGYFATKTMKRMKNTQPDGYLIHLMYWIGVSISEARTLPNPYEKRFVE